MGRQSVARLQFLQATLIFSKETTFRFVKIQLQSVRIGMEFYFPICIELDQVFSRINCRNWFKNCLNHFVSGKKSRAGGAAFLLLRVSNPLYLAGAAGAAGAAG